MPRSLENLVSPETLFENEISEIYLKTLSLEAEILANPLTPTTFPVKNEIKAEKSEGFPSVVLRAFKKCGVTLDPKSSYKLRQNGPNGKGWNAYFCRVDTKGKLQALGNADKINPEEKFRYNKAFIDYCKKCQEGKETHPTPKTSEKPKIGEKKVQ
jgi:hypothetical protein